MPCVSGGGLLLVDAREEGAIGGAALLQLVVGALVEHAAVVDHHDAVGESQRRAAVGHEQGGATLHQLVERSVDLVLDAGVDRRGGVVEDQDARVGEQRPGQGQPLALPAGQGHAALAHGRVVPTGGVHDEVVRLGRPGDGLDLRVGRVLAPVGDVGAEGVGEQEAVLEHHADLVAQRGEAHVADVGAVDADRSRRHVVEAGEEQGEGGLPRARGAHQRHPLARRDLEREVLEDRLAGAVAEPHVVERDRARAARQVDRVVGLGHDRLGVEQVHDAFGARAGLLRRRQEHGEHAGRRGELGQVGEERQERAHGDATLDGEPASEQHHGHLAERGHRLEQGGEAGAVAQRADPTAEEVVDGCREARQLVVLLPEALHDPDAGDRLLGDGGHLGLALGGVPGGDVDRAAHPPRHQERGRHRHERHQRQQGREPQHDGQREHQHHDVAGDHADHLEHALDHAEVGVRPADQLSGLELVVAGEVEVEDVVEDGVAQVVLHEEADPAARQPPGQRGEEPHHRDDAERHEERGQRLGVGQDHVVDDRPLHQRDQRGRDHADDGGAQGHRGGALVREDPR